MNEREREREEKKILVIIDASQMRERKKNLLQILLSKLHPSINGLIPLI